MHRRRHVLQRGLALIGFGLVAGCRNAWLPGQPASLRRIGYLAPDLSPSPTRPPAPILTAFIEGLRELGYVDGQTVQIVYRWGEGQEERLPALATELVALPVDVILAAHTSAA